ncbi:hypothetical protein VTN49DRAFT_5125 [Thermomyces lanuginosus]|uniref:uncharacterized protein n=1 Tax=Thermomyces lanuginosus TaxID=5541 RepID=UPI0037444DF4
MSSTSSPSYIKSSSPDRDFKQSRFTYRHLQLLAQNVPSSPLRVVAHIDLDAFYAQCEMVRLGVSRETPLAVQQWDALIAVNYAARPFGISRMISVAEAKKRCPNLILQHVATFREGEGGRWAYREDAAQNIGTDKVSLDPYRKESRKILGLIHDELSKWRDLLTSSDSRDGNLQPAKVEKASVDEVFIDLSSIVYGVLRDRYAELRNISSIEDKSKPLPPLPTTVLEWSPEDGLVDLDKAEMEEDNPDWDDMAMLIGAEVIRSVREAIYAKLGYTCSAGISRNKMIAKLGSGRNKPNKQTIVRNRAIQNFLSQFKFTQIRMLGGKLGDQVSSHFGTDQVTELLKVPLEQFKAKFDDDTAIWLYGIIRGVDHSEVNTRTQIKSMLSAKSFTRNISSVDQAEKWLRIFAADLYGRLVEDGILEHRRRPKTITLHNRSRSETHSKQLPIPGGKTIDEDLLFDLARTLLAQIISEGRAWPSQHLSLSVSGFEEGPTNNRAIDGFLVRGPAALELNTLNAQNRDSESGRSPGESGKKRKADDGALQRYFKKSVPRDSSTPQPETEPDIAGYQCPRCNKLMPEDERGEHEDWHFAKDLSMQDMQGQLQSSLSNPSITRACGKNTTAVRRGSGKPELKQTRLTFK